VHGAFAKFANKKYRHQIQQTVYETADAKFCFTYLRGLCSTICSPIFAESCPFAIPEYSGASHHKPHILTTALRKLLTRN